MESLRLTRKVLARARNGIEKELNLTPPDFHFFSTASFSLQKKHAENVTEEQKHRERMARREREEREMRRKFRDTIAAKFERWEKWREGEGSGKHAPAADKTALSAGTSK